MAELKATKETKTRKFVLYDYREGYDENDEPVMSYSIADADDLEDVVVLADDRYLKITGNGLEANAKGMDTISALLKLKGISDIYEAKDLLESEGYTVEFADDYERPQDVICWNYVSDAFILSECSTEKTYTWWDGSNWIREWPEASNEMLEVVTETTFEDLDSYDRNGNKYFRRQWQHGKLYKVLSIDGNDQEDTYLLVISSQYQGSKDVARLIDADERLNLVVDPEEVCYKLGITTAELNQLSGGLGGNAIKDMLVRKHGLDAEDPIGGQLADKGVLTADEGAWLDKG